MQQDGKLKGRIRKLVPTKNFGFIRYKGLDYFFHRSAFQSDWQELIEDASYDDNIAVFFEVEESTKGPRATNVERA